MNRMIRKYWSVGVLVLLLAVGANADQRSYVWTYESQILAPGEAEVEYYYTISGPDGSNLKTNVTTEHKLEYEVGMSEHYDFAIYQVFRQEPDDSLRYEEFQLRSRYRVDEKGEMLLDPVLYLEYKGVPDFSEHAIEFKLILSADWGRLHASVNPVVEFEWEDDEKEWESEFEYAIGVSYELHELLKAGLESKGSQDSQYWGPTISHGKGRFWSTLGAAFALGDVEEGDPEVEFRLLLGLGF